MRGHELDNPLVTFRNHDPREVFDQRLIPQGYRRATIEVQSKDGTDTLGILPKVEDQGKVPNFFFLKPKPPASGTTSSTRPPRRTGGIWSMVLPAVVTARGVVPYKSHDSRGPVIDGEAEPALQGPFADHVHPLTNVSSYPEGTAGLLVAGTDIDDQYLFFMPTADSLRAVHNIGTYFNPANLSSSEISDMGKTGASNKYKAEMHTGWTVELNEDNVPVVAITGGRSGGSPGSGDDTGYFAVRFGGHLRHRNAWLMYGYVPPGDPPDPVAAGNADISAYYLGHGSSQASGGATKPQPNPPWNLRDDPSDPNEVVREGGSLAYLSHERYGFVHPGHSAPKGKPFSTSTTTSLGDGYHQGPYEQDKHHHGFNSDGTPINSAHIWTNAYYYMDTVRDAPLEFSRWSDPPNATDGWAPLRVRLRYSNKHWHIFGADPRAPYNHNVSGLNIRHNQFGASWHGGFTWRRGLWRWSVHSPLEPAKVEKPVTGPVITPGGEYIPPSNRGGHTGQFGMGGGDPGVFGPAAWTSAGGARANANKADIPIAARRNKREPNQRERSNYQSNNNNLSEVPGAPIVGDSVLPPFDSTPVAPPIDGSENVSSKWSPDFAPDGRSVVASPTNAPHSISVPALIGRAYPISESVPFWHRFSNNNRAQLKAYRKAPLVATLQFFGAEATGNTRWDYTTESKLTTNSPDSRFNAGTASGGAYFTPPEVMLGSRFTPPSLSSTYFALHPDVSLAWGTPDVDGLVKDGFEIAYDSANDQLAVVPIDAAGDPDYTKTLLLGEYEIPLEDGTTGQVLKTNGSGIVSWQDESGGGGGWPPDVEVISSSTNYSSFNKRVLALTDGGAIEVTLDDSGLGSGDVGTTIYVKRRGNNTVTILSDSSYPIEGDASGKVITVDGYAIELVFMAIGEGEEAGFEWVAFSDFDNLASLASAGGMMSAFEAQRTREVGAVKLPFNIVGPVERNEEEL